MKDESEMPTTSYDLVPEKRISKTIFIIRGEKVILDSDLAEIYGIETRRLNEQVRRYIDKFPEDFMFQLSQEEFDALKSQLAASGLAWDGRRKPPLVFTENGVMQASNIINSPHANKMSIYIVRAFVQLREKFQPNANLAQKVDQLEQRMNDQDEVLVGLVQEIRKMVETQDDKEKPHSIGFIFPEKVEEETS